MAQRLRQSGHNAEIEKVLSHGEKARTAHAMELVERAVEHLCTGTVSAKTQIPTFAEFAEEWTSGALHKRFPDHVAAKDSEQDARTFRLYVIRTSAICRSISSRSTMPTA